jgi:hypothetical protein
MKKIFLVFSQGNAEIIQDSKELEIEFRPGIELQFSSITLNLKIQSFSS